MKFSAYFLERGMSKVNKHLEKVTLCLSVKKARCGARRVLRRRAAAEFLLAVCVVTLVRTRRSWEVTWHIPARGYSPVMGAESGDPSRR